MKFVTRENPKVDRVACPWLIKKFIDPNAQLLFVPASEVIATAEREGALPYDVPNVELGHYEGSSSFESFIRIYNLGEGLRQIVNGWHLLDWSLEKRLEFGFALYDCFYAVCQKRINQGENA